MRCDVNMMCDARGDIDGGVDVTGGVLRRCVDVMGCI